MNYIVVGSLLTTDGNVTDIRTNSISTLEAAIRFSSLFSLLFLV
jgi:hypothetical protein